MSEASDPAAETAAEPRNLAAEYRKLPGAERWLALAAVIVLLAFIFTKGWDAVGDDFYPTLSLFGTLIVLVLVGTRLYGMRVLRPSLDTKILVVAALLPASGYVVDQLRLRFWGFGMLAGAALMAYLAIRISAREKLIKSKG